MNKARQLAAEVREYCVQNQHPEKAQQWARYFKEGYDSWGMLDKENPLWNEKRAEWLQKYHGIGLNGFMDAGEILLRSGKYEEASMAIRFTTSLYPQLTQHPEPVQRLARFFAAGIRNWGHTDVLCGELLSPLLSSGVASIGDLKDWRHSEFYYQRRAVPVALLVFVTPDASIGPLLEFIEPMMEDDNRFVQQGLGWFLRECWKKRPKEAEPFLLKWKDRAARVIYQYATEKMTAEKRARFRRGSSAKPKKEKGIATGCALD